MNDRNSMDVVRQAGFTLVELGIVMVVSGMLLLMGAGLMKGYYSRAQYDETLETIRMVKGALAEYVVVNGRYPCPSDPTLLETDAGYGLEQCRTTPLPLDCSVGVPLNIKCTVSNSRDSNGDTLPEVVMIGMLPINTILAGVDSTPIRGRHAVDGYGNRFTYSVTEILANTNNDLLNPVKVNLGAIRVEDGGMIPLTDPPDSARYVVVSHGQNGKGAYNNRAALIAGCQVNNITTGAPEDAVPGSYGGGLYPEIENCDRNDAIFVKESNAFVEGNKYYDDVVVFEGVGFQPLWVKSFAGMANEIKVYNTNLGDVAVGPGLTNPQQALHVQGDLSAQGAAMAQGYCSTGGPDSAGVSGNDDCMFSAAIAGNIVLGAGGTKCTDPLQAAYGIENNEVRCRDAIANPPISKVCPLGEYLVGISNLGNIRCAAIP